LARLLNKNKSQTPPPPLVVLDSAGSNYLTGKIPSEIGMMKLKWFLAGKCNDGCISIFCFYFPPCVSNTITGLLLNHHCIKI
jgi:hypothetical protein